MAPAPTGPAAVPARRAVDPQWQDRPRPGASSIPAGNPQRIRNERSAKMVQSTIIFSVASTPSRNASGAICAVCAASGDPPPPAAATIVPRPGIQRRVAASPHQPAFHHRTASARRRGHLAPAVLAPAVRGGFRSAPGDRLPGFGRRRRNPLVVAWRRRSLCRELQQPTSCGRADRATRHSGHDGRVASCAPCGRCGLKAPASPVIF
jgi:hypothetical protein